MSAGIDVGRLCELTGEHFKRATFPLGAIATSCLVPSSQDYHLGFSGLSDSCFGDRFSSQGCQQWGWITGNLKHFPQEARIVSPSDMINILNVAYKTSGDMLNEPGLQYIPSSSHIAWEAVERMRASAVANGVSDMSMEEIDEEIRQYREERRSRL